MKLTAAREDFLTPLQSVIGVVERHFAAVVAQMVERQVRRDAAHPCTEVTTRVPCRFETCVRFVGAPESFHRQVLRGRVVAHDSHHPTIDVGLVLSEERLESVHLAERESFEQFHISLAVLYYCRGGRGVTGFLSTLG